MSSRRSIRNDHLVVCRTISLVSFSAWLCAYHCNHKCIAVLAEEADEDRHILLFQPSLIDRSIDAFHCLIFFNLFPPPFLHLAIHATQIPSAKHQPQNKKTTSTRSDSRSSWPLNLSCLGPGRPSSSGDSLADNMAGSLGCLVEGK